MEELELLNGEYALFVESKRESLFVAEIRHIERNMHGGQNQVPIGALYAYVKQSDGELYKMHWSVNLYFRTDIRYSEIDKVTTIESRSTASAVISAAVKLLGSSRELYNSSLIEQIGVALLSHKVCVEPMVIVAHHCHSVSVKQFGSVIQDDEEDDEEEG